jgi:diadenosine tetraphosphate (Ap4A) HIT family hydrolase
MPHVHWHVIPRYADDLEPGATVWIRPEGEREALATPAQRDERVQKLREAVSAV